MAGEPQQITKEPQEPQRVTKEPPTSNYKEPKESRSW